jgi:uncharacterized protein involved in exopolysaccharide biosynthesis
MSEQELSISQACEIARQMANHFRAFTQVHQVLEKAMVSKSFVDELEAQLATLKPQIDVLVARRDDAQEKCTKAEEAYTVQMADQESDLAAQRLSAEQVLAELGAQMQMKTKQIEEAHMALLFTHQQEIEVIEAKRDRLQDSLAMLQVRKKNLAKEFGEFVGDSNNG